MRNGFVAFSTVAWLLVTSATRPSYATELILVDEFRSPVPAPQFGLDFDESTHTLWGSENFSDAESRSVWHFDLEGNLLSNWPVVFQDDNLLGIAIDVTRQRVFYFQNLHRSVVEATMDGSWLDTVELPWGYQNSSRCIEFDPLSGHILMINPWPGDSGFIHVSPESKEVLFREPFDLDDPLELGRVSGFCITEDDYWLLGYDYYDSRMTRIVRINRSSLQVMETFDVPGGNREVFSGLARDPETGLLYTHDWSSGTLKVFEAPEPHVFSILACGLVVLSSYRKLQQLRG